MSGGLKVLAFDTVGEACSVALSVGGEITQELEIAPNRHSQLALGMAQSLLRRAGFELRELDALAVDVGPGSFTGVRIGIGIAQGLGYGANLAVIPVGSLEALACAAVTRGAANVLAAIDARMEQVYCARYGVAPDAIDLPREVTAPTLLTPAEVSSLVGEDAPITGAGSGWDRYAPAMLESLEGRPVEWLAGRHPEAASIARIATARGLRHAVSPLRLNASYVRDEVVKVSDRETQKQKQKQQQTKPVILER